MPLSCSNLFFVGLRFIIRDKPWHPWLCCLLVIKRKSVTERDRKPGNNHGLYQQWERLRWPEVCYGSKRETIKEWGSENQKRRQSEEGGCFFFFLKKPKHEGRIRKMLGLKMDEWMKGKWQGKWMKSRRKEKFFKNVKMKEDKWIGRQRGRVGLCTDVDGESRDLSNGRLTEKQFFDLHGTSCYHWQQFMQALTLCYWVRTARVHIRVLSHAYACAL